MVQIMKYLLTVMWACGCASTMVYKEFEINHPFVYAIVKTSTNEETGVRGVIPLFAGHVVNPEY